MAKLHVICALRDKRSELAGMMNRLECQSASKRDPLSAFNRDPSFCAAGTSRIATVSIQLGRSCG